jgi:phosphopantothenate---cysteine ligase (CTP)
LIPTPKIISRLRDWFPRARIAGWKYEVDGDRAAAIAAASKQIRECLTDVCVANGPAYGLGFGVVTADGKCYHTRELPALCELLEQMVS